MPDILRVSPFVNLPHFPFPCGSQAKPKLVFAVSLICTLGALIAMAFGLASLGAAKGWWTVSSCAQLAQSYQIALLAAGGAVALVGCNSTLIVGLWLSGKLERARPAGLGAAPQAEEQPQGPPQQSEPIQPASLKKIRQANFASTLREIKDLCDERPLALEYPGSEDYSVEFSSYDSSRFLFRSPDRAILRLHVDDQFLITKIEVTVRQPTDTPDISGWYPCFQKMMEICPPWRADRRNIVQLMRNTAFPVMQTNIGEGYSGRCWFDFNQHHFVYEIQNGDKVVCTLTRLLRRAVDALEEGGDFGPIAITGDLPEGLIPEKLFEPVDRNLESPDPFAFSADGKEYFAWFDFQTETLSIQEQRHFNNHLSEGKIEIRFDQDLKIPKKWLICMMSLAERAASRADWSLSAEHGRKILSFAFANFSQEGFHFQVDREDYFASYDPTEPQQIFLRCETTSDTLAVVFERNGDLHAIRLNEVLQVEADRPILLKKWATALRSLCSKPTLRRQDWVSLNCILSQVAARFSPKKFESLKIPEDLANRTWLQLDGPTKDASPSGRREVPLIQIRKLPNADIEVVCLAQEEDRRAFGLSINMEGERYFLWSDTPGSMFVNIESYESFAGSNPKERLCITFCSSDHTLDIDGVRINGVPISEIPQRYINWIKASLSAALNLSASYEIKGRLEIQVMPQGLHDIPRFHLDRFCHLLGEFQKSGRIPKMRVVYLNDDWSWGPASDHGGPSQTYLSLLFDGLMQDKGLKFKEMKNLGLFAPQATPDEREKLAAYEQMGMVLMFCYLSDPARITGEFIHPSIFEAVFSLSDQELEGDWTPEKQVRILSFLMQQEVDEKKAKDPRMIALYSRASWRWSKADLEEVQIFAASKRKEVKNQAEAREFLNWYFFGETLLLNLYLKQKWEKKDLATVQEICATAREDQPQNAMDGKKYIWDAILSPYRAQFAPIQAIARGMQRLGSIIGSDANTFRAKAQGVLDRECVAESFRYEGQNEIVKQKVTWLKEWVRDARTPTNEIKQVLLYLSGSMGISSGARLEFRDGEQLHTPFYVGTCSRYVLVAPRYFPEMGDHTKAGFIAMVKGFAQGGGAFTQG